MRLRLSVVWIVSTVVGFVSAAQAAPGQLALDRPAAISFRFDGVLGERIDANLENWLLRAPRANPGLLEMFRVRDRQPAPNLVPWAGEFVGKYLISAVQSLRLRDDERLRATTRAVIDELIASQADDGYLGPFPRSQRLLGHWDLWGHYHVLQALLLWHETTGDERSLAAVRRAADLICRTYLDSGRRVFDAGSHEMNMAVIHVLGHLHRLTGEERYLALMRAIEQDWQRSGDYLRTGLAGVEFFRTPLPRWESLHDLQGLVELYQITGDAKYKQAFLHHWQSIRRLDRHNNGAFSSGEQATGHPYAPGAIETCCTIAWMAMSVDALRLTGDAEVADELELSTYNGMAGSQHPSGSWWTYNTPMDGAREASAHSIVFQARAGTPELNCCSVNGPRGLGMLSEWSVMQGDKAIAVNFYGPLEARLEVAGSPLILRQETSYPIGDAVKLTLDLPRETEFGLRLRIPAWSRETKVAVNGQPIDDLRPGRYAELKRSWKREDVVTLRFDMRLRYEAGDEEAFGRASIYRGPLLLAYDQRYNTFDEDAIPMLDPAWLADARVVEGSASDANSMAGRYAPWLLVEIPFGDKSTLTLCDFASAGASGTRYRSWIPAKNLVPPPPVPLLPADGAVVGPGAMLFTWRSPAALDRETRKHRIVVSETDDFTGPVIQWDGSIGNRAVIGEADVQQLKANRTYYWKLVATNAYGETASIGAPKSFRIDPALPQVRSESLIGAAPRSDGLLVAAKLAGNGRPEYGVLESEVNVSSAAGMDEQPDGALQFDGQSSLVTYRVESFPERDYTLAVWLRLTGRSERLGQVFSAWTRGMDDPLRLCVHQGKLFARIEAGQHYSTDGVALAADRWYHVAVVKAGERLTLYVDGEEKTSAQVPVSLNSHATNFALGGNPNYRGESEFLPCRLAQMSLYARALSGEELDRLLAPAHARAARKTR